MISEERFKRIMSTIHSDNLRMDEAINLGLSEDELPLRETTTKEVNEAIDYIIGLLKDLEAGINLENKMENLKDLFDEFKRKRG